MTKTRAQFRQATAQELQVLPFATGTATTGGGTNKVVSSDFSAFSDNKLRGAWLHVDGVEEEDFQITSNDESATSADYRPATASAALDSQAYEILPFQSVVMHNAMEAALDEAYDEGWLVRPFTLHHWGARSPIYNGSFHYWTSATAPDGWAASGSLVATRVQMATASALGMVGNEYISFGTAAGNFTLDTNFMRYLTDYQGTSITLRMLCRTDTASALRIRLLGDAGATLGTSGYHDGDNTWHVLTLDVGIAETNTQIRPQILVDSVAGSALVAAVWLEGGPFAQQDIPFPLALAPHGPDSVEYVRFGINETNEQMFQVDGRPHSIQNWELEYTQPEALAGDVFAVISPGLALPEMSRLVMHCSGPLTKPSNDTDPIEIRTDIDLRLLAKMAARILLTRRMSAAPASLAPLLRSRLGELQDEIRRLSKGKGASDRSAATLGIPLRHVSRSGFRRY